LDPWLDRLDLLKSKPAGAVAEREKMPFEVTPFMPYLARFDGGGSRSINANAADPKAAPDAAANNVTDPKTPDEAAKP
jgi:hypothetical protein